MTVLAEIVCSVAQEEPIRAAVEAFCKEAGSQLIGRRVNEEAQRVQLIVRLPYKANVNKDVTHLSQALQQNAIESFRYLTCDLVYLSFDPSVNLQEQMQNFPLRPDETWFPAFHDQHQAYVCMAMPIMSAKQAAWLLAHEVEWEFV